MPSVRPCSHSARNPEIVLEIVVDAVDDVQAVGARGDERHRQPGHDGEAIVARPCPAFFQEIVGAENETGETIVGIRAAGRDFTRIDDSHRRFDHRPKPNVRRCLCGLDDLGRADDVAGVRNLRNEDGVRRRTDGRVQIGHAPGRLDRIDAQDGFARAEAAFADNRDGVPSGDLFIGRRNRVFEIDDDRIRGERFRLFERVLVVAGNVENAAPGSHRHRQRAPFVNAYGALHNSPLQRAAQLNFGTTNKNPAICCELNHGHTCYGPAGRSKPPRCKPQGPCARSSSFHHTSPTERSASRLWLRPLQQAGIEVTTLPTIVLSNHPGLPRFAGKALEPALLADMTAALDANGWLGTFDAILSGYLPSAGHVAWVRALSSGCANSIRVSSTFATRFSAMIRMAFTSSDAARWPCATGSYLSQTY